MVLSAPLAAPRSWVPRLPEPIVERPRLDALLSEDQRRQITLVSAPPGAGKTTLLAGWVRRTYDRPVAWLTLEASDDRQACFARSVLDALAGVGSIGPRDPVEVEDSTELIDAALEELAVAGHRVVLVIDDAHELTSADAVNALVRLVERAPPALELLIGTRADPPLRLGRLRLDGRLGSVRNADLLFRPSETAELFHAHGLHVGQTDIISIHRRAEGWAAGLRLIAFALEKGADPKRFALEGRSAEEAVSEYLFTEVLDRQEEAVQRFLLRTSVVDELTPDLAVALCDDPQAASRLEDLERRGVFLSELDGQELYRYHTLFAALLRARLRHRDPDLSCELHGRAARWYAARGTVGPAEHHARMARDWPLLGDLVVSRWLQATLAGQEPPTDLVVGVPDDSITAIPSLALVAEAGAAVEGDRDRADRLRASRCASPEPPVTGAGAPLGPALVAAELVRARAFGRAPVADPRADPSTVEAGTLLARFAALCEAELSLDDGDPSRTAALLAELAEDGSGWTGSTARALLALVHAVEGRLGAARSQASTAIGQAMGVSRPAVVEIAGLALALANAQHGQRAVLLEAEPCSAIASAHALRRVDQVVRVTLVATPGGVSLDRSTAGHPFANRALAALGALEVVDPTGARVPVGGAAEDAVLRARHSLEVAAHGTMSDLLAPWVEPSAAAHPRTTIEASVLLAVATSAQGDHAAAGGHLGRALAQASPERLWAPLRTYGPLISAPLDAVAGVSGPHQPAAMMLLDEARQMQAPPFVQPLTEQERAVLRLLSTLMSNTEIAEAMHLSVNTIKTHLKALYRKLGVDRRRDAVVRARQLELI